jgi:hypothetical protein
MHPPPPAARAPSTRFPPLPHRRRLASLLPPPPPFDPLCPLLPTHTGGSMVRRPSLLSMLVTAPFLSPAPSVTEIHGCPSPPHRLVIPVGSLSIRGAAVPEARARHSLVPTGWPQGGRRPPLAPQQSSRRAPTVAATELPGHAPSPAPSTTGGGDPGAPDSLPPPRFPRECGSGPSGVPLSSFSPPRDSPVSG